MKKKNDTGLPSERNQKIDVAGIEIESSSRLAKASATSLAVSCQPSSSPSHSFSLCRARHATPPHALKMAIASRPPPAHDRKNQTCSLPCRALLLAAPFSIRHLLAPFSVAVKAVARTDTPLALPQGRLRTSPCSQNLFPPCCWDYCVLCALAGILPFPSGVFRRFFADVVTDLLLIAPTRPIFFAPRT